MSESVHPAHCCLECGETTGNIQHVDVAWPGSEPFWLDDGLIDPKRPELGGKFKENPKANGRHVVLWLHPDCEKAALERIEKLKGP
jgi:hypothetical protein